MMVEKGGTVKQNFTLKLAVLSLVSVALAATRTRVAATPHFVPPDIVVASDIAYPINNTASGLVSVSLNLSASGQIQNVLIVRDIPGLTAGVTSAVNTWTFTPAKLDGIAVPSTLNVHVVFNPGTPQNQQLQLPPGTPVSAPDPPGYLPPTLSQVSYAVYPPNSIAQGAVVLDVLIDKDSQVKKVTTIRDVPSLTQAAVTAGKTWSINPAKLNNKKLDAKLVVAFVFRSPTMSTP